MSLIWQITIRSCVPIRSPIQRAGNATKSIAARYSLRLLHSARYARLRRAPLVSTALRALSARRLRRLVRFLWCGVGEYGGEVLVGLEGIVLLADGDETSEAESSEGLASALDFVRREEGGS